MEKVYGAYINTLLRRYENNKNTGIQKYLEIINKDIEKFYR